MGTSESTEIVAIVQNPHTPPKRQHRDIETKRKLVEATLVPGASVARVARTNGVNTNQLFSWRRLYLAGRMGEVPESTKLLPVTLQPATSVASSSEPGTIHCIACSLDGARKKCSGRSISWNCGWKS